MPDTARALKVRVGSPLIELVRVVIVRMGRGVEHLHALYCPDRYNFEMDLVRSGEANARTWKPDFQNKGRRSRAASMRGGTTS
jgi:GntR family transcriptional regulator